MEEMAQVKELIRSGFDLELISFELGIPLETIKEYELYIKNDRENKKLKDEEFIESEEDSGCSGIREMREKYRQLYMGDNSEKTSTEEILSPYERKLIKRVVESIEDRRGKIETLSEKERRENVGKILDELEQIEKYQLPLEDAEKLYRLGLEKTKIKWSKLDSKRLKKQQDRIAIRLAEALEREYGDVDDIDKLQELNRRIGEIMGNVRFISTGQIKARILKRISDIKLQQAVENLRSNISTDIVGIIKKLASGNIDIREANGIIDQEAKRRVEGKPKTRFSLTEEQERKQILLQIKMAIIEKADRFQIQNPEKAIVQIQELCGGEEEVAIRTVVENLANRNEFEDANRICDGFIERYKAENAKDEMESDRVKYVRRLKNEIRNREISSLVIKTINMSGTKEEEERCYEILARGLRRGNVKLQSISLGKSKDGTREIRLDDVWPNQKENDRDRQEKI